ncbi:MAG: pentapeptide repeat-containing protein, partial [bacterium]
MTDQKARETLEAEWWERWWKTGYSWAALTNHSLGHELFEGRKKGLSGEASLQEYWRRDPETGKRRTDEEMWQAAELIKTPDGMLWHRAHVPLKWQDGSDAKEAWDDANKQKLANILSLRLTKARQDALKKNLSEPNLDHRAQFSGVVLPDLFRLSGIGLQADDMLPVSLVIADAWIGNFFASDLIFESDADFSYSFISGLAGFSGAEFKGKASFREVIFGNFVSFAGAHFRDEVWLNSAIMLGPASFQKTQFFGAAYFTSTSLRGTAAFRQAVFHNSANFNSVNFEEFVDFSNSHYKKIVSFSDSNFASQVFFDETIFEGLVFLNHTSFEDKVSFSATKFCQEGYFRGSKFKDSVSFSNIQAWGNGSYAWSGAFYGASASAGILSFEDSVPPPFAAFDGLHLAGDALLAFDDDGEKSLDAAFDHQTSLLTEPLKKDREVDKGAAALDYPRFLGKLAGGCRVFKNYFDSRGDRERAQRFFRLELQARMKSGEVGRLE